MEDALSDALISTAIDKFIRLIKEKGRIELGLASRILNVPTATIEEWAHILDDEGIIDIEYKLSKVYAVWVAPSEEEIAKEKGEFEEHKKEVISEFEKTKEKVMKEKAEIESLSSLLEQYDEKISKRMAGIESTLRALEEEKKKQEDAYYENLDKLENILAKISEINDSINFLESNLKKIAEKMTSFDISENVEGIERMKKEVEELNRKYSEIEKRVEATKESLLKYTGTADIAGIVAKFEEIEKEYARLKRMFEEIKDASHSFSSSLEIVESTNKALESLEARKNALIKELRTVSGSPEEVERKLSSIIERKKVLERELFDLGENIEIAKSVLSGAEAQDVLNKVREAEGKFLSLGEQVEKLREVVSNIERFKDVDEIINELSELKEKVEESRERLASEAGAIFDAVNEEVSTFSSYQKIKDKIMASVQEQFSQLEDIKRRYNEVKDEVEKLEGSLDALFNKLRGEGVSEEAKAAFEEAENLVKRKRSFEEIKSTIADLKNSITNLSKEISLLSKELELITLRSGGEGLKEFESKAELTSEELGKYEEKRREVSELVKKLWESEHAEKENKEGG
jgi:chromosome segregation ATPase